MKFLLDHDVPAEIAHLLRYWEHNVTALRTVLPVTASDEEVFNHACSQGLILISCNQNIRSAARAFVLWNMVKPGTKISRELDGLEAMLGLPVLKVAVPERIGFTYASLQGYDTVTIEDRNLLQRLVLEFLV